MKGDLSSFAEKVQKVEEKALAGYKREISYVIGDLAKGQRAQAGQARAKDILETADAKINER